MQLQTLMDAYARRFHLYLEITDQQGETLLSTTADTDRLLLNLPREQMLTGSVLPISETGNGFCCIKYTPLTVSGDLQGYILTAGQDPDQLSPLAESFQTAAQLLLETQDEPGLFDHTQRRSKLSSRLIRTLMEQADPTEVAHLLQQLEQDTGLHYCLICIRSRLLINQYFDINLNLGYAHSIHQTREDMLHTVRSFKHFSTRDIIACHGQQDLLILKALQPPTDLSRTYRMLDAICAELSASLEKLPLVHTCIAHSQVYADLMQTKHCYAQANAILELGLAQDQSRRVCSLDDVFLDVLLQTLPEQILQQSLSPRAERLLENGNSNALIDACSTYLDLCFHGTAAAQKLQIHRNTLNNRLAQWTALTGLKPETDFTDAVRSKLLIMMLRKRKGEPHDCASS